MISNKIITGIKNDWIWSRIWLDVATTAWKILGNPWKVIMAVRKIDLIRRSFMGNHRPKKLARTGDRYYWDIMTPGWPSTPFTNLMKGEINRIYPYKKQTELTSLMLSVTNKCPMQCEHCYEWDNLNQKDRLTTESLKMIVKKFQLNGTAVIMLGGGEPMLKYQEIIEILRTSQNSSDFWLVTSGLYFTNQRAKELKAAGLTGIYISLDNHKELQHDSFRNYPGAYQNAMNAAKCAVENEIVVGLSLCPVKSFLSKRNLHNYANLAREWGVSFILMVEPRDVGHYAGKDVLLNQKEYEILEDFFSDLNNHSKWKEYPIVTYPAYHQQNTGCYAAGSRYMFIDQMGDIQTCPFCRQKGGNVMKDGLEKSLDKLRRIGCSKYPVATI